MNKEKHVYWFDESSIHVWLQQNKTWTGAGYEVTMPQQSTRGSGRTMYAAMGGEPFKIISQTCETTDTDNTMLFLKHFVASITEPIHTVVLVADNHPAHHSKRVKEYCERVGLEIKFLPAYSSPLNPVERLWALVKHRWKKQISRMTAKYNHDNLTTDV